MKVLTSHKGFTLIELLVVIGILAVLAAIAIPSVAGLIDRANVSADSTNANEMTNSMERFTSEYELYCQDIASGTVNIGDMDAAQGRVYNVIGVTDRAGITALEVAPDAVVEEDQIAIYRDTKYPANAKTARLVVENYTKTSSSTFEPKQSDMNYWYSPDCGVVVFAEPEATVEQLNLLVQSGKDAKGNGLSANTHWINLTNMQDVTEDSADENQNNNSNIQEHIGKKYTISDSMGMTCEFNADGTLSCFDVFGNTIMVLPAECIVEETNGFALQNLGAGNEFLEQNYYFRDNGKFIVKIEGGEEYLFAFDETHTCLHKQTTIGGKKETRTYWYGVIDETIMDYVYLTDIDMNCTDERYTMRCRTCFESLGLVIDGNYIYTRNSYFSPQKENGGNWYALCADNEFYNINGWNAVPFDVAKMSGMQSTINGEAVTATFILDGITIPKTVKTLDVTLMYYSSSKTEDFNMTYDGTKAEFKMISMAFRDITVDTFLNEESSYFNSVIVHCSDGDLVYQ